MMRLIAIRQIRSGCGSIEPDQAFVAGDREGERLIKRGDAMPELHAEQRPYKGSGYWTVQPEWKGETVVIIAGGPSVSAEQIDLLGRSGADPKIIAINNACELAEWADILYFCDDRWYTWHKDAVLRFAGRVVTLENLPLQKQMTELRCLRDYGVTGFAPKADGVTNGRNSGYQALHLAALLGAARVLLLGFDMRVVNGQMHWHDEHPVRTPANIFDGWLSTFDTLAPELAKRGVEVTNCTPGSALKVFPHLTLAAALGCEPPVPTAEQVSENDRYIDTLGGVSINTSLDQDAAPEPIYAPLRIQIPQTPWPGVHPNQSIEPAPPPSTEEAKPEVEHAGTFGGAGAGGSWDAPAAKEDA